MGELVTDLVEVSFLGPRGVPEVMPLADAALRVGVTLDELEEALEAFGACETDGYLVLPHPTLAAFL